VCLGDRAQVEEEQRDLDHGQAGQDERGELGERVVQPAQRPGEVQRQHVAAQVAGDELRCLGRDKDDHDDDSQLEYVRVIRNRPPAALGDRYRVRHGRQAHDDEGYDRHDLGLGTAAEAER
jgi:hypothetical protein